MKIVWDEPKRLANLEKHGLDFASLDAAFFDAAAVKVAKHGRYSALGLLRGRAVVLVFALLGREAVSVISLRPASSKERERA